ncbi:MAG: LysM peptidoglycan-binding domain-containing protein [Deltaproteobacteria bacterium]|nr:MAG: LysM peptidoglycan-binding domain-containing protein [Deltaproteobacteria bacterium]
MMRPSRFVWAVAVIGTLFLFPVRAFSQQEAAPAEANAPAGGIVHTVVEGDTLWDLSAKHLGSPWKWTGIWERNRFITNPHYIYPGIKVVIVPPPPREFTMKVEPPPAAAPEPVAPSAEAAKPAPVVASAAGPVDRYLDILPEDFVRAGEFVRDAPKGIGRIRGGKDPKVGFAENDAVYLGLDKTIPAGQMLGVYRVRGPIRVPAGGRPGSGYVKYLIGIIQVGPSVDGQLSGKVRQSFEDITREDLLSEEIPAYSRVKIVPGEEGIPSVVITARQLNKEIAPGDFIYFDKGASAGVAQGNVFRVFAPATLAVGSSRDSGGKVRTEAARAVIVRVNPDFSTAYIASGTESFAAGVSALRGIPAK